jgi:LacI family transcriptional regulator
MTTIKDIARIAKVSVGTVSNYLNAPELLAEETKDRIRQAIDELGYYPKAAARSLKSKQTRRIGIVPVIDPSDNKSIEPSDIAFLEFLGAVNTVAAENNYSVLLSTALQGSDEMAIYRQMVGGGQVDGFILMGIRRDDPRLLFLDAQNFPYVAFGRSNVGQGIQVDVDGATGIELAFDHLVKLGHQKIAFITPPKGLMCTQDRLEGFQRATDKYGLDIPEEYIVTGDFQETSGQISMHLLLDLPNPPTAVIAANDVCAFGAMNAMAKRGLRAGKDISIVGFDDTRLAAHWTPPLTTVSQPFREIGFKTSQMLIDLFNGKDLPKQILLTPGLVVRSSTGNPG